MKRNKRTDSVGCVEKLGFPKKRTSEKLTVTTVVYEYNGEQSPMARSTAMLIHRCC
jgi:hypothetical protein